MVKKDSTNVRINSKIKKRAQKLADEVGMSFSAVVNILLRQFVQNKKLEVDLSDDIQVVNVSQKEHKILSELDGFGELKEAVEWIK